MRSRVDDLSATAVARLSALALLLAVLLAVWPAPARAHSDLVGSTPRAGDTVALGTERLVLVFSDPLVPGQAQVLVRDAAGRDVSTGRPALDGPSVEVPLRLQRPGRHAVTYRVLSADGHTVVGELAFSVRAPADAPASAGPAPGTTSGSAPSGQDVGAGTTAVPVVPEVALPAQSVEDTWVPSPLWWLAALSGLAVAAALLRRLRSSSAPHPGTDEVVHAAAPAPR
ncbi:copper resistance CopC family protein [Nocardioides aequoreus]|uniref:copper resistance CopC family protein n=1 Tax=Nocardioides aequoreus TaxID=397278 RepID=UPI00068A0B83|nr:copper resistance CopC family protein [Nocardioides aequoreus]